MTMRRFFVGLLAFCFLLTFPLTADSALRGYLAGYTMSTAGASTTMTIGAGSAADGTNAKYINLSASLAKTTSAWALGAAAGCLDTGAIANSTWYHFWAILRSDTGVVDVLCSLSATTPTMPTNYDYKRRIGSGLTNGSGQWTAFTQDGDLFQYAVPVQDINNVVPNSSAASTRTLSVPTGINVIALFMVEQSTMQAGGGYSLFSDLATTDTAPTAGLSQVKANTAFGQANAVQVRTNTAGQIRSRMSVADAASTWNAYTYGWIDRRGRDN